jgi:hypothetical protein
VARGRKKGLPKFSRDRAKEFAARFVKGETYEQLSEGTDWTADQIRYCMEGHSVLSEADVKTHWVNIMKLRRESGKRVGRKPRDR